MDSKPYAYAIVSVIGHLYTKTGKAVQPRYDYDDESTTWNSTSDSDTTALPGVLFAGRLLVHTAKTENCITCEVRQEAL